MRNISLKVLRKFGLFFILLLVLSCSNHPKQQDSKSVAEEHNDAKFENNTQNNDAQFLVDAAEINLKEIQLGQLAQQQGVAVDVKKLGKTMEEAHTKAQKELQDLAKKKQITVPTSLTDEGQNDYKKLSDEKGKDFDKEYCNKMVKGHKDAIERFEKAARDAVDPDIKAWASGMIPSLRAHLDQSITCQNKHDKNK